MSKPATYVVSFQDGGPGDFELYVKSDWRESGVTVKKLEEGDEQKAAAIRKAEQRVLAIVDKMDNICINEAMRDLLALGWKPKS